MAHTGSVPTELMTYTIRIEILNQNLIWQPASLLVEGLGSLPQPFHMPACPSRIFIDSCVYKPSA